MGTGSTTHTSGSTGDGFIILETNYRLYAYTGERYMLISHNPTFEPRAINVDNPLQTAVLNLFATLKSRFPNLVVGSITRDSVKKALANGISADQVHIFRWVLRTL